MTHRIFVSGYYGFGNEGDEVILEGVRAAVGAARSGLRWTVVSGDPARTVERHAVAAVPWRDPAAIAEAVAACDLVIVGGGGLFQDYWGFDLSTLFTPRHSNLTFYGLPIVLAALLGKPAVLYAVGVGPLTTEGGRSFVRALAGAATSVSVRDEGSRAVLAATGVPGESVVLAADPVFALAPHPPARPPTPLRVGVSLRDWPLGPPAGEWESQLAAGLDRLLETHPSAELVFVPLQTGSRELEDDLGCSERVRARLRNQERTSILAVDRAQADPRAVLAGCDVVLGMRLHAVYFALAAGRPVVALAYDPKVASALSEAGRSEDVVRLGDLAGRDLALALLRARPATADYVPALRRRAARAAELALAALDAAVPARMTPALGELVLRAWQAQAASASDPPAGGDRSGDDGRALAAQLSALRSTPGVLLAERCWRTTAPLRRKLRPLLQRLAPRGVRTPGRR